MTRAATLIMVAAVGAASQAWGAGLDAAPPPVVAPPPSGVPPPPVVVAPPPVVAPAPSSLRGAFVYVYSFLDVRAAQFGARMLDQLDQQLVSSLAVEGVQAKVLRFKDSAVGENFSQTTGPTVGLYGYYRGGYGGSDMIPVRQTIAANFADERAAGARFRLIEFPANFTNQGAWQYYDVRWELDDARTGVRLWTRTYSNTHLTWWRADEDSVHRARAMLDKVFDDLRASGYL